MRRKSLTVDLPLTPSFFRQFCAAPAVLPTIVCPFLVETDVFVRIAGLFVTLLSTGAAIACVITQYFLSWRGAILHLGLIQVCAAGTCENIPYPNDVPSKQRSELYAALALTLTSIAFGVVACAVMIINACPCKCVANRVTHSVAITFTFLAFASLVTAFVLVIVAKPPLETFLSNQFGFDMTFSYDYTFWVCLGGWCGFLGSTMIAIVDIARVGSYDDDEVSTVQDAATTAASRSNAGGGTAPPTPNRTPTRQPATGQAVVTTNPAHTPTARGLASTGASQREFRRTPSTMDTSAVPLADNPMLAASSGGKLARHGSSRANQ